LASVPLAFCTLVVNVPAMVLTLTKFFAPYDVEYSDKLPPAMTDAETPVESLI